MTNKWMIMVTQVIDKPGEDKNTKGMSIAVVSISTLYWDHPSSNLHKNNNSQCTIFSFSAINSKSEKLAESSFEPKKELKIVNKTWQTNWNKIHESWNNFVILAFLMYEDSVFLQESVFFKIETDLSFPLSHISLILLLKFLTYNEIELIVSKKTDQKITILHREGGVYRDPQKWL